MKCKKIIVAVDASDNAMRAVQYTGNIIGSSPGFTVELLTIERFPARDLFPDEQTWKASCEQTRVDLQPLAQLRQFPLQPSVLGLEAHAGRLRGWA